MFLLIWQRKLLLNHLLVCLSIHGMLILQEIGHLTSGDVFTSNIVFTFIKMFNKLFQKKLKIGLYIIFSLIWRANLHSSFSIISSNFNNFSVLNKGSVAELYFAYLLF